MKNNNFSSLIQELLLSIPRGIFELDFILLTVEPLWKSYPKSIQKLVIKTNFHNYDDWSKEQFNKIYLLEPETKPTFNDKLDIVRFLIHNIPHEYGSMKTALIARYKEAILFDTKELKTEDEKKQLKNLLKHLENEISNQKDTDLINEMDVEFEVRNNYKILEYKFNIMLESYKNMIETNKFDKEIMSEFIYLFIDNPNFDVSNCDKLITNTFGFVKEQLMLLFKKVEKDKDLLNLFIDKLTSLLKSINESVITNKEHSKLLHKNQHHKRLDYRNNLNFSKQKIELLDNFIKYIKRYHLGKCKDHAKSFKGAFKEKKTFDKIIIQLKNSGWIKKSTDELFTTKMKAVDFMLLADKLDELKVLILPFEGNSNYYGELLNDFLNKDFAESNFRPGYSNADPKKFDFISL